MEVSSYYLGNSRGVILLSGKERLGFNPHLVFEMVHHLIQLLCMFLVSGEILQIKFSWPFHYPFTFFTQFRLF